MSSPPMCYEVGNHNVWLIGAGYARATIVCTMVVYLYGPENGDWG